MKQERVALMAFGVILKLLGVSFSSRQISQPYFSRLSTLNSLLYQATGGGRKGGLPKEAREH
jgi:hypothetical protein